MEKITIDRLSKSFDETPVLREISFTCEPCSLTVLLGASGCGKSTTLRLIAGLEKVDQGQIHIGNREVTGLSPKDRKIAMVFQNYALFPHLTVAENILFGLKARRVNKEEQQKRLKEATDLLHIGELLHRRPSQLSGGQRQRVALGRAIVFQSPICLMDEPLSNLDAKLRQQMRIEIRSLQQRLAMTMIYVTHDQAEAMSMADQVILMKDGGIEQQGRPEELYQNPATCYAGNFLGTPPMNILTAEESLRSHLQAEGFSFPHTPHFIGVRPEHIRIREEKGMEASVENIEYMGALSVLNLRLQGQLIVATHEGKTLAQPGETFRVSWEQKDTHLFDEKKKVLSVKWGA